MFPEFRKNFLYTFTAISAGVAIYKIVDLLAYLYYERKRKAKFEAELHMVMAAMNREEKIIREAFKAAGLEYPPSK